MSINYNIFPWNSTTLYYPNNIVSLSGANYFCRLQNINSIPYDPINNIDNTENGLGLNNCIWSENYFFWIPSYSSTLEGGNLTHRFASAAQFNLIKYEKANKNTLALNCIFDKRGNAETTAILEFIRNAQGSYSVDFTPQSPYNYINKFIIQEPKHTFVFFDNNTVEAKFTSVYGVVDNFAYGLGEFISGQFPTGRKPRPSPTGDLLPFDFAILRYTWTPSNGRDLDTRTAFINTNTYLDGATVGWQCPTGYPTFATGITGIGGGVLSNGNVVVDSSGNPLLTWGHDNVSFSGYEDVLVNLKQAALDLPGATGITVRLRAYWFGQVSGDSSGPADYGLNGQFTIQFQTFLGGTMIPYLIDGSYVDWINSGGAIVQNLSVNRQTFNWAQVGSGPNGTPAGIDMGTLVYNVSTKTASINS